MQCSYARQTSRCVAKPRIGRGWSLYSRICSIKIHRMVARNPGARPVSERSRLLQQRAQARRSHRAAAREGAKARRARIRDPARGPRRRCNARQQRAQARRSRRAAAREGAKARRCAQLQPTVWNARSLIIRHSSRLY